MEIPQDFKIRYLSRRKADLAKLLFMLEKDDFTMAQKLGHQLKGNASTFEFSTLALLGEKLENASQKKDKEAVIGLLSEMEDFITATESLFQ